MKPDTPVKITVETATGLPIMDFIVKEPNHIFVEELEEVEDLER
jgi:hypothetical protein